MPMENVVSEDSTKFPGISYLIDFVGTPRTVHQRELTNCFVF